MACHAARRLGDMNLNLTQIIGIELLTAAQGVEFREPLKTSPALQKVMAVLRAKIPALGEDRYLANDLNDAAGFVRSGALIEAPGAAPRLGFSAA